MNKRACVCGAVYAYIRPVKSRNEAPIPDEDVVAVKVKPRVKSRVPLELRGKLGSLKEERSELHWP